MHVNSLSTIETAAVKTGLESKKMRRLKNLKIVATIGPSSNSYEAIKAMFEAGADVYRLNMSHCDHAEAKRLHEIIRTIEKEVERPIGILVDLQGPKLRCGKFAEGPVKLAEGDRFRFDLDPASGDGTRACLPHKELFEGLKRGASLLVNDGKIRLKVEDCGPDFADCRVIVGGFISSNKGVNLPDVVIPLAAMSEKDRGDLEFACELGVDWLALSFVQTHEDVLQAKALAAGRAGIVSKIEKPSAVNAFDAILKASDGIMVARGDLGVELPLQSIPPIQKRLIRRCRAAAKPVIVATQMLESMIQNSTPTRAEISDVAAAIYEGADAVMLSAESAAGRYPTESVRMMHNVAVEVEKDPTYRDVIEASRRGGSSTVADAIVSAAREIAETTNLKAVCCFTHSGTTVNLMARERPRVPMIALTPFDEIARRLNLVWGVHCVVTESVSNFDEAVARATQVAADEKFGVGDDNIAIMAGVPFNVSGTTNIIQVVPVGIC